MYRILLTEDDLSLIDGLKYSLHKHGFEVAVARTVRDTELQIAQGDYDLVLLDVMLPDGSGFDLCRKIRKYGNVPIVFLTASDEEVNVVMGLDNGADDYITKPFRINELISRINAVLRRASKASAEQAELVSGNITLKLLEGRACKNGHDIELTSLEYRLLSLFMENPEILLSKEQIMQRIWNNEEVYVDDNTLAVYISRLRDKLEDNPKHPQYLITVRGMGYKWRGNDYEYSD